MKGTIQVKSGIPAQKDGGSKCVLFEKDERHPDGEIFISDPDRFVEAFPTPAVMLGISKGDIVQEGHEGDANTGDGSETGSETGSAASEDVFALEVGETVDSLANRLSHGELALMADHYGAEYTAKSKKHELAEAILAKA